MGEVELNRAIERAFPLTGRRDLTLTEVVDILIAQRDDALRMAERADRRTARVEAELEQLRRELDHA